MHLPRSPRTTLLFLAIVGLVSTGISPAFEPAPAHLSIVTESTATAEVVKEPAVADEVEPEITAESAPIDVVVAFVDDLGSEEWDVEKMTQSGLVRISPYCPAKKRQKYMTAIRQMRGSCVDSEVDREHATTHISGDFASVVFELIPSNSGKESVITGFALVRKDKSEPWAVAVGIRHFNNTGYTNNKSGSDSGKKTINRMIRGEREMRLAADTKDRERILKRVDEAREKFEIGKLTAREVVMKCIFPQHDLDDYERLAFMALKEDATAPDLRKSLSTASRINRMCGLNSKSLAKLKREQVDGKKDDAPPITRVPWMPSLISESQHQWASDPIFLASMDVRKKLGVNEPPMISILEEKKFEKGDDVHVFMVGIFDASYAGRFAVAPIYVEKQDHGWAIMIPPGSQLQIKPHGASAFSQPNHRFTRWASTSHGKFIDMFAAEVMKEARERHPLTEDAAPADIAQSYTDAARNEDTWQCTALLPERVGLSGMLMHRTQRAMERSFGSLAKDQHEMFSAADAQTDVIDELAAITWTFTIEVNAPENMRPAPVITEHIDDQWFLSPNIHSVAPINDDQFAGMQRNRPELIDRELTAVLGKLDKHRVDQRDAMLTASFKRLMSTPVLIDPIDGPTPDATPPSMTDAREMIDALADAHADLNTLAILKTGAVLNQDSDKRRKRILSDIGNDRLLFEQLAEHLEVVDTVQSGRWLGVVIRDSRIIERETPSESPSTEDTLSMRLFVRHNDQWLPMLGTSFIKEENVGMKWINKQSVLAAKATIGKDESEVFVEFIKQLNETPVDIDANDETTPSAESN